MKWFIALPLGSKNSVRMPYFFRIAIHNQEFNDSLILATFRVRPDQLSAFLKLMPEYWEALRAQDLVLADPHLVLQGEEHGRPTIVEVFSWKDHEAPENVPAQIQTY